MYKNKKDECVLCGKNSDITKEHHPTKALIKNVIYNNYLVFPTCKQCNNSLSFNEEFLVDFVAYYNYYYFSEKIDSKIMRSINRNNKIKQYLDMFFNDNQREIINKSLIFPLLIKYAKIHNYICHEYYNDNAKYNVTNIKFIDEMSQEDIEKFFSPVKVEYDNEEKQIDYFDKILNTEIELNYLASNYYIGEDGVYKVFNKIIPGEYEFVIFQDYYKSNVMHFKLNIKNIIFCEISIIN